MQPEPLFEAFDAGWVLLIVAGAALLAYGFIWLIEEKHQDTRFQAKRWEDEFNRERHEGAKERLVLRNRIDMLEAVLKRAGVEIPKAPSESADIPF
jgi:hypothetical protein